MARSDDALLAAASEDAEAFGLFYRARLSKPWTTAVRRDAALAGIDGELRRRLERLPRRVRVRSYIASLDVPPEPGDAGLRLVVELKGGKVLRTGDG